MVHENAIPVQSPLDGAALLDAFDTVKDSYRSLDMRLRTTHCNAERRRLLSKQRAVFRAGLTLTFAQAERDVEAAAR